MPKRVQRSPEERRAIVERFVAESAGKAPATVNLLVFREGTPAEFEHAKSLQGRAREALRKNAKRAKAAA